MSRFHEHALECYDTISKETPEVVVFMEYWMYIMCI